MADIELVIKIDEEKYKWIKSNNPKADKNSIVGTIVHGIPLPKGHGDLIDRNDLLVDSYYTCDLSGDEINVVDVMTVEMADAIIEADKEQSNEQ